VDKRIRGAGDPSLRLKSGSAQDDANKNIQTAPLPADDFLQSEKFQLEHYADSAAPHRKPPSPKNHKAGLVGPALLLWNWFGQSCFHQPPRMSKLCKLLHHQGKVLQFILQDRQGAPRHFHAAGRVQRRLGRNPIAAPHQEDLQQHRSLV
jgi:hypothetical protein